MTPGLWVLAGVLVAVPLFVFAANIMNAGTVSERIFDFCRILVGRMRGSLAQVDILVSVIFSGMSGSAIADAAGPVPVAIKQMLKKPAYSRGFAGAVVVDDERGLAVSGHAAAVAAGHDAVPEGCAVAAADHGVWGEVLSRRAWATIVSNVRCHRTVKKVKNCAVALVCST